MPNMGIQKPRILLVTSAIDLAEDLCCWLSETYTTATARTYQAAIQALDTSPAVVLLIETKETEPELHMPALATVALDKGCRVIRLAYDWGRFDSRWDNRVVPLPLGVHPKVLLAAIKGFRRAQADV